MQLAYADVSHKVCVGGTETLMQTNRSMQTLTDLKVKPYDEIHSLWNFWHSGTTSGPFTSQGYVFREA